MEGSIVYEASSDRHKRGTHTVFMQSRIRDLVGVGGFVVLVAGVAMYDKATAMIVGGGLAFAVALYGTLRQ